MIGGVPAPLPDPRDELCAAFHLTLGQDFIVHAPALDAPIPTVYVWLACRMSGQDFVQRAAESHEQRVALQQQFMRLSGAAAEMFLDRLVAAGGGAAVSRLHRVARHLASANGRGEDRL